jgi:hypothetical protein
MQRRDRPARGSDGRQFVRVLFGLPRHRSILPPLTHHSQVRGQIDDMPLDFRLVDCSKLEIE